MTQIDFRDPGMLDRLKALGRSVLARRHPAIYASALAILFLVTEAIRAVTAMAHARDLERRRDDLAREVEAVKKRTAAQRESEKTLIQALHLRRANARLALEIAEIGNALPPQLALTTLRNVDDGQFLHAFEIDGRTTSMSDVATALRRLRVTNVEIHRDDSAEGAISFHLSVDRAIARYAW